MKALVISYYFPPVNHIAAQRADAFQRYFPKYGINPVIATRHWSSEDKSWEDYFAGNRSGPDIEKTDRGPVLRLPFRGSDGYARAKRLGRTAHQAYILTRTALGDPQPEIEIFRDFFPHLKNYLERNPVDAIVSTFQPASVLRLGHELSKEAGIPYVADFRDVWNPAAFGASESANNERQAFLNKFQERYFAKWLSNAALVSAVNQPIIDRIATFCPSAVENSVVVTNGFEADLFESVEAVGKEKFTFSVIGTLYAGHDLSIMLDGLNRFLENKSEKEILLNFVGAAAIEETTKILRERLPQRFLNLSGRILHNEAIRELKSSHVLFYVGWKGYKGMTPGKIFDYLGARRNILIAPSDHDTIERIVKETKAGRTADSVEDFVSILEGWYREWKEKGAIPYIGDEEAINFYTRENQTAILAREILGVIERKQ
ncbi:MAG: hypothetical protein DWQ47_08360 [Acidobacteria bacterium]|nr:MAG: hypothetical protein DWQ32_16460 [Acidobacteriota bacterium]REJ99078.1 MAG: hypothetical protein DWQ38_13520 [Acidobacteriota bacterium]REK16202.1 MAG: hypothetical protein DWQ43_04170 [Acidobacteriota bacterium]REK43883.1 MAG: hypothetical protein DWQ47_08360 [Acidobacteriota bacterium]